MQQIQFIWLHPLADVEQKTDDFIIKFKIKNDNDTFEFNIKLIYYRIKTNNIGWEIYIKNQSTDVVSKSINIKCYMPTGLFPKNKNLIEINEQQPFFFLISILPIFIGGFDLKTYMLHHNLPTLSDLVKKFHDTTHIYKLGYINSEFKKDLCLLPNKNIFNVNKKLGLFLHQSYSDINFWGEKNCSAFLIDIIRKIFLLTNENGNIIYNDDKKIHLENTMYMNSVYSYSHENMNKEITLFKKIINEKTNLCYYNFNKTNVSVSVLQEFNINDSEIILMFIDYVVEMNNLLFTLLTRGFID